MSQRPSGIEGMNETVALSLVMDGIVSHDIDSTYVEYHQQNQTYYLIDR